MITKTMECKEVRVGDSRVVIALTINMQNVEEGKKVFDKAGLRMFSRKEAEEVVSLYPKLKEELRGVHFDTSDGEGFFVDEKCSHIFKAIVRTDMPYPKASTTD